MRVSCRIGAIRSWRRVEVLPWSMTAKGRIDMWTDVDRSSPIIAVMKPLHVKLDEYRSSRTIFLYCLLYRRTGGSESYPPSNGQEQRQ